jgi:hypothetical protein
MSNMTLWDKVCKTNPKYTKKVNQRGGFTAIDAQYQVQEATEQFGAFGEGWGIIDERFTPLDGGVMLYQATFFWGEDKSNKFDISSSIIYNNNGRIDADFAKKVATDALTKALSKLGFNADIFLGLFDDNKYVAQVTKEFAPKAKVATTEELNKAIAGLQASQSLEDLKAFFVGLEKHVKNNKDVIAAKDETKSTLS